MQIRTAESLLRAFRESGLFSPDEVAALARDLAPHGDDVQTMLKVLIQKDRVPVYQLRKIVHAKTAELFYGPYVILDKLGEGGMGKVYKAKDTRHDRIVALKVVRSNLLANPVVRGRYDREVQAVLALNHPNVASAYEAGESDGRFYLALEFVDGIDLARLVRTFGLLPVPEACEYLRQAALGLQHAHDRGFVHRDIKPSNIVVSGERHHSRATEAARVKILDMGLIRTVGLDDGNGADLTRDGTVVGTPDYMAPEQAKNSSTVDHRADLYNLGGAFYYLLTGKPPFSVGSPIEKILKHQLDPPPPLQATRPDVPDDLARIVARLMAKKPEDRFPTADALALALLPLTRFTAATPAAPAPSRQVVIGGGPRSAERPSDSYTPSTPGADLSAPPSSLDALEDLPPRPTPKRPATPRPAAVGPADRTPTPRQPPRGPRPARRLPEREAAPSRTRLVVGLVAGVAVVLGVAAWLVFK